MADEHLSHRRYERSNATSRSRDVAPCVCSSFRGRAKREPGIWTLWIEIPGLAPMRHPGMTPSASGHALPGLAAAEHAAEGAALHAQQVRALHRDGRVVVASRIGIVNAAAPLGASGLHVDQDLLVGLVGIAAEIGAAGFNANIAFV